MEGTAARTHHENCGDVGDTGDHGDLGTNAAPDRRKKPSAADLDAAAQEAKAKEQTEAPAPPVPGAAPEAPAAPQVAIVESLLKAGYTQDEAERLADSAVAEITERRTQGR